MPPSNYSAPGKLFLFGEYAVLAGGWSVVAAVNRRVYVRRLSQAGQYDVVGATIDDPERLPRIVYDVLGKYAHKVCDPVGFQTDVGEFYWSATKLGLGSSAASTVALVAACLGLGPTLSHEDREMVFSRAFRAHRQLQDGRGSGADVAASAFGGILGYRLHEPTAPFPRWRFRDDIEPVHCLGDADILPLGWPSELAIKAVWLGTPAKSPHFIRKIEEAIDRDEDRVHRAIKAIADTSRNAIHALQSKDASGVLDAVRDANAALDDLGKAADAPILTRDHRALVATARKIGAAAKPSGAGGGDFSIVVGPHDASWWRLENELPRGCRLVDLEFGAVGVSARAG